MENVTVVAATADYLEKNLPRGWKPPAYIDVPKLMAALDDYDGAKLAAQNIFNAGKALRDMRDERFEKWLAIYTNMTVIEANRYIMAYESKSLSKGDLFYVVTGCVWEKYPTRFSR